MPSLTYPSAAASSWSPGSSGLSFGIDSAAQSSWGRAAEGDRRCSVLQLEEEEGLGLWLVCTATSCGWCEASRCSTRLNLQAAKGGSWREKSRPANCVRRRRHIDVAEFQGWQDDSTCSGAWLRHGLRGRPGWSDVHEGVVELLLSLSLLVASSQVRQRRVRVRQRGVSLGPGPLTRRDVSMVHQKLRRRWRITCKLLHACCWQEWRSVPGAGA